jgi:type IV pilus assembly protein PilO
MATGSPKRSPRKAELRAFAERVRRQFVGLDPNDPSLWPPLPRVLLLVVVGLAVCAGLWFAWLGAIDAELAGARAQEQRLRDEYREKVAQVVNLDALRKQREQVRHYVSQLERQLPSRAEMDALLSDINQAGLGRNLQFELFRPGQVTIREYYAELPITIRVVGRYHDVGQFAADIAQLPRIVTLNDLSLTPARDREGELVLEGTAKTYRYLDPEEIEAQQRAKAAAAKKGGRL